MSSNLVYHTRPKQTDLSHELKQAFQVLYGCPVDTIIVEHNIPQLKAMAVVYDQITGKKKVAKELHNLIKAIDKYTEVYLKEDFG